MYKILSIDGGGIRGLVPLVVLSIIEKRTKKQICEMFDLIAGTSTGSIIAGLLSIGTPTSEILDLYLGAKAQKIFNKPLLSTCPKYNERNLEDVLKQVFSDKKLEDCTIDVVIPADDWQNRCGKIFSTFDDKQQKKLLWKVTRASSAAESYFPAYIDIEDNATYFDGGMYANNPADLALIEVLKHKDIKLEDCFIVSLGTGTMVEPLKPDQIKGLWYVGVLKNILMETMDRIIDKTHDILSHVMPTSTYYRLQFECPKESQPMDLVSQKNLKALVNVANYNILGDWDDSIKEIIKEITK